MNINKIEVYDDLEKISFKFPNLEKRVFNKKDYWTFKKLLCYTIIVVSATLLVFLFYFLKTESKQLIINGEIIIKDTTNYKKLDKADKKGKEIYTKTGRLSFFELDKMFNRGNIDNNTKNFNHIHIAMSFNDDYHLLSLVTIASILKNAKENTFIHLHIIAVDNFFYPIMKKINSLKAKINNNTEFIFHNGDRAVKDFGKHIKKEFKGIPEFSRLLAPYLINETDRILVLDSGDLIIKKDLVELYNYPLEDKLIKGVIDPYTKCFPEYEFFHKENYFNGGVLLFNSKKWREMDLYNDIIKFYKAFHYKGRMPTPIQDILNTFFPSISYGLMPLRYNFQGYVNIDSSYDHENYLFSLDITGLDCSMFYQDSHKVISEEKNLVIRHNNKYKPFYGESVLEVILEWRKYAKITGFYHQICRRYPKGCFDND